MKRMSKKIFPIFTAFLWLMAAPLATHAQSMITQIIKNVNNTLFVYVIGILFLVATVVFLWGVVLFIAKAGDPPARAKAKRIMTWGIIGFTVMAVAWGVTAIIFKYFGIPSESPRMSPPPIFKDMFPG